MVIKVKKHNGYMCLLPPEPYIATVVKVFGGKFSKNWNCIVADWTSVNCRRLMQAAKKYAWTIESDQAFKDAVRPLIQTQWTEHVNANQERLEQIQDVALKSRLWNHQRQAFLKLNGLTGAVLDMGMGTGKSLTTIAMILAKAHNFGIIVCPKSVVPVWPLEFQRHCAKEFMIYSGPKRKSATISQFVKDLQKEASVAKALGKPFVIVCNYEKIWQGDFAEFIQKTRFDFIVYDECVPAGTKIATPTGECCIESLNTGDVIYGYDDEKNEIVETKVCHCFNRRTREPLYSIAKTQMTGNHPVWTDNRGYIRADQLSTLDTLGHIGLKVVNGNDKNYLRMVRNGEGDSEKEEIGSTPFLFKKLLCEMEVCAARAEAVGSAFKGNKGVDQGSIKKTNGLSRIPKKSQTVCEFREKSVQRSKKRPNYTRKGGPYVEKGWVQPSRRRQWVRVDNPAKDIGGNAWVGNRSSYLLRKRLKKARITDTLLCRYSKQHPYDCNRNRRAISFGKIGQIKRRKEGCFSIFNWLEGRSLLKQGGIGRCREVRKSHIGAGEEKLVYNIETETGNYFANGLLVHNCHRLKSGSGRASKFAAKIRPLAGRIIGCTGTLLPHSPLDAFGVFRAVDPGLFGTSYIPFRATYAVLGGFEGKQVVAFQNEQLMHDKITSISYRVKSEDVLDLPPFQHIIRHCELAPKTRKAYDQMHNDLYAEYEGHEITAANAMVKVLRLQQITSGIITDSCGNEVQVGTEKADLLADILEDIAQEEPVVVFCRFTADIEAVLRVAGEQGRRSFELSGRVNQLKEWQDAGTGVLAVQIRAGKEGVDFTNACIQVYYSIGHSLGDYDQSLKRTHRPGQTRPVCYIHIVAKDTVDVKVYESLDKKRDIVEYVLETLRRV